MIRTRRPAPRSVKFPGLLPTLLLGCALTVPGTTSA